jgi:hypothetical protein
MSAEMFALRSSWKTGAAFLEHLIEADPPRFFHPIPQHDELPAHATVGAILSVTIVIEERAAEVHLHARVLDRRDGTKRHGLTLEILPAERDRFEFVLVAARGESLPFWRRRHPRMPYVAPCRISPAGRPPLEGTTTNINAAGTHVAVEPVLRQDAEVEVEFRPRNGPAWSIRGRVAEVIREGPQRGLSIEFLFSSAEQRDAVRARIERLRAGGTGS